MLPAFAAQPSGHRPELLYRNVQRFRGCLVFKAHRLVCHSTLDLIVIQKREETNETLNPETGVVVLPVAAAQPSSRVTDHTTRISFSGFGFGFGADLESLLVRDERVERDRRQDSGVRVLLPSEYGTRKADKARF